VKFRAGSTEYAKRYASTHQSAAIQFTSEPEIGNACKFVQSEAIAATDFKTAAFDRSATPPRQ